MKTFTLAASMIAVLFFVSCSKDSNSEEQKQDCQLVQNIRYEDGNAVDSFNYQYNGAGQVISVNGNNYNYALEYENNKIVRRKYSVPGATQLFAQDTVQYNTNGTISRIERKDINGDPMLTIAFAYASNKLTSVSYFDEKNVLRAKYDYSYTINNITAINAVETWNNTNRSFQYKLAYDTNPNNFRLGQQALLMDGFLGFHVGLTAIYVLSDNRVKTFEENGAQVPVSYTFDNNNNVTAILVGAETVMRGTYECK